MTTAAWALQKALINELTSNAFVFSLLGQPPRVFDHVPRGSTFPYVTLGLTSERDWSTGTEAGSEHIASFHVWSRAAGREEADTIMNAIKQLLHDVNLALDSHHLINIRHTFSDIRRTPDNDAFHGIVRMRAVTEPSP